MKKMVVLLLASLCVANIAFAVTDEDDNMMGVYFDANADVYNLITGPYAPVDAYVMLTNPTFAAVYGYEFSFVVEGTPGGYLFSGVTMNGTAPIDVGGIEGNHIVGLGAPMATEPATLLATLTLIPLSVDPIYFTLGGANPPSIPAHPELPVILLAGSQLTNVGLSTLPGEINGVINGLEEDVVATDATSWDNLKSLYR